MAYATRLVRNLKPDSSWKFLDVGCGMGGIVLGLRKLGFRAWGTEVSSYCLRHSPAKKWIEFANICNLPFSNQSFEVVTCIDVLYYLDKREERQAIKELTRVAKDYVYVDTMCKKAINSNQRFNPDSLRKDKDLLTEEAIKSLFALHRAFFLRPLFSPREKGDFNGIFTKENKKNNPANKRFVHFQ